MHVRGGRGRHRRPQAAARGGGRRGDIVVARRRRRRAPAGRPGPGRRRWRWTAEHTNPRGRHRDAARGGRGRRRVHRASPPRTSSPATTSPPWPTDAIVFALANPDPEVDPVEAARARRGRRHRAQSTSPTRSTTCWPSPASSAACSTPSPDHRSPTHAARRRPRARRRRSPTTSSTPAYIVPSVFHPDVDPRRSPRRPSERAAARGHRCADAGRGRLRGRRPRRAAGHDGGRHGSQLVTPRHAAATPADGPGTSSRLAGPESARTGLAPRAPDPAACAGPGRPPSMGTCRRLTGRLLVATPLLEDAELPAQRRADARPRRGRRPGRRRQPPARGRGRGGPAGLAAVRRRPPAAVPGRPGRARLGARPGRRARGRRGAARRAADHRLARAGRPGHPARGRRRRASPGCGSSPGTPGWGEGQLEEEIAEGAWYVVDAEARDAFSDDPDELWRQVLRRQGGDLALVATYPEDPRLN